nr:uncharacterized protein LOC131787481 [Pocillopora verrucosa]
MIGGFCAFEERLVTPAWVKFAEERTEHRFTLFGTDIDVIRPEIFLMEFVLMEKSEGLSAQFFPQLPHGCFACCCLNMSFIHIPLLRPKTLPAVCADLVNHEYQGTFQLISGAVMFSGI